MMEDFPKLTNADIERMFNVHRTTVVNWRKSGLPHFKIGGKIYYKEEEVREWVESKRIKE